MINKEKRRVEKKSGGSPWPGRVLLSGLIVIILLASISSLGQAQDDAVVEWEKPILVHSTDGDILQPSEIIADAFGRVHIFWAEQPLGEGNQERNHAINYSRREQSRWSWSVDILSGLNQQTSFRPVVEISDQDIFHVLWKTPNSLYYSTAPAALADQASNWAEPVLISEGAPVEFDMVLDANGKLHIVYVLWEDGIYYMTLDNKTSLMTNPTLIGTPLTSTMSPNTPQIGITDDGTIHVFWTEVTLQENSPRAVRYNRSKDGGTTWISPHLLHEGKFVGREIAINGQEIHLLLIGSAQERTRGHKWSADGGLSWSEFNEIVHSSDGAGKSHGGIVIDNNGTVFALFGMKTDTAVGYASWDGTRWSDPQILPDLNGEKFEDVRMAIGNGNKLHAMYVDSHQKLWYSEGLTQAAADPTPEAPFEEVEAVEAVEPTPEPTPEPTATIPTAPSFATREEQPSSIMPVIAAMGAALVFVLIVILISRRRKR